MTTSTATSMGGTDVDQREKVRENRLRRMAERQGLELVKSRRRDPKAIDYDRWAIVDPVKGTKRPAMSLEDVERLLESSLVVDLRQAARAYRENPAAASQALQALVLEAIKAGMPEGAVALVSEVALEDIVRLKREAEQKGGV